MRKHYHQTARLFGTNPEQKNYSTYSIHPKAGPGNEIAPKQTHTYMRTSIWLLYDKMNTHNTWVDCMELLAFKDDLNHATAVTVYVCSWTRTGWTWVLRLTNAWHMGAVSGRIIIVTDIFLPRKSFPEPVHSMTLQEWLPSSKHSTFLWNDRAYLYMGQRDRVGGYCNGGHNETR